MLERELFAFLENTADAAFAVSEGGEIHAWNKAAEKLFGYPAREALDKYCHEILVGRGARGVPVCIGRCAIQEQGSAKAIGDFDLEVQTRSGERIWVNISTLFFEEPRRNRRLIVHLARDISRRKKNEELLGRFLEIAREVSASDGPGRVAPVSPLSEQEIRILRLFAKARNSAEIARELGIALPTLRNHLHSINEKLRTHNRLEAVMHAMQRGLI